MVLFTFLQHAVCRRSLVNPGDIDLAAMLGPILVTERPPPRSRWSQRPVEGMINRRALREIGDLHLLVRISGSRHGGADQQQPE